MNHLQTELQKLKTSTLEMMQLVKQQLNKTSVAFLQFDKGLAREVIMTEKRVNSMELKIDRDCENIFLLTPMAVDLRFVISVLKINSHLERMADNAEGICRYVAIAENPFNEKLIDCSQLRKMFAAADDMLASLISAFENEDAVLARKVLQQDEQMDAMNHEAWKQVAAFIQQSQTDLPASLNAHSFSRKVERIGDLATNVAEEIIFYLEAKVMKHQG